MPSVTRRTAVALAAGLSASAAGNAPVINGAEHAWVIHDRRFAPDPEIATCPANLPNYEYSGEFLLSEMKTYGVDGVVISHVCYYGRDNSYTSHCIKTYPGKFAVSGFSSAIVFTRPTTRRIRAASNG
jgi:hypothetical protein